MTENAILIAIAVLTIALFAVLCWFLMRRVWPYVTNQVELSRQQRQKDQDQFMAVLASYQKSTDSTRMVMTQMQEILSLQTNAIGRLVDEINRSAIIRPPPPKRPKDTP